MEKDEFLYDEEYNLALHDWVCELLGQLTTIDGYTHDEAMEIIERTYNKRGKNYEME